MGNDANIKIVRACCLATRKHAGQTKKDVDASPYINHIIDVVDLLIGPGEVTESDIICAAFLHDIVEDSDVTLDELEAEFGRNVASMVGELTDSPGISNDQKRTEQVERAGHISDAAQMIKLADKSANLALYMESPPPAWSGEELRDYIEWGAEVVERMNIDGGKLRAYYMRLLAEARKKPAYTG